MSDSNPLKKIWTVRGEPFYETAGHKIKIDGEPGSSIVTVTCLSCKPGEHTYEDGSSHDPLPLITSDSYTITLVEQSATKNVIECKFKGASGGSWTADDSLPED